MQSVIAILPFALATAISPMLLAASIFAISEKSKPLAKSLAFVSGCAISIFAIGSLIILLNLGAKKIAHHPTVVDLLFELVAAISLIIFATFQLIKKNKESSLSKNRMSKKKYFLLGMALMFANTSSIMLYFPAAVVLTKESAPLVDRLIALTIMIAFTLLPAALAPVLTLVAKDKAKPTLGRLSKFTHKYGALLISIIFYIFGSYLLLKVIYGLIKVF